MNDKQFKETLIYEEMATNNDSFRFMIKSYLDIKLKGNVRKNCYLYSVKRISPEEAFAKSEGQSLDSNNFSNILELEIKSATKAMIELFNNIKKNKYWKIETQETHYYDKEDKEIFDECPTEYTRRTETTTTEYFMLDKELDIKPKRIDYKKVIEQGRVPLYKNSLWKLFKKVKMPWLKF